jgi:hypothetical protein
MATHVIVVEDGEAFQREAERLGVNGEGQEKAVCLFSDGSNLHHAMAYRWPVIIHMVTPTIDCRHEVALMVQHLEGYGAKVMV